MLKAENLHVYYGMIHALKGVGIEVAEGEIVAIIGANGGGKSTFLNTIAGMVRPSEGSVEFMGRRLPVRSHEVVKAGIALVPEGRRIFGNLSVYQNLVMGAYLRTDADAIQKDMERVYRLFPRLKERERQPGSTLSGGEQQMLAIGRALMSKPKMLLLDEPSLGLAPILVRDIFTTLRDINREGTTILLVEQNARQALDLAQRAYVFQTGNVVLCGSSRDLLADRQIQEAYLGARIGARRKRMEAEK
ncbi:MAG: ABC transporter ATP-binding protein [Ignavibacteriales bacterium]